MSNNWYIVCFTGHRPDKLPGKYDWNHIENQKLMVKIRKVILEELRSRKLEKIIFIFGGALGVDTICFDICENIRNAKIFKNVKLVLAIPFKKQSCKWINKEDVERYQHQLNIADRVIYVDTLSEYKIDVVPEGEYHPAKMQKRNEWMVDNSNLVIAVWDKSKGGTANCVNYAKRLNKEIIIINPMSKQDDISKFSQT